METRLVNIKLEANKDGIVDDIYNEISKIELGKGEYISNIVITGFCGNPMRTKAESAIVIISKTKKSIL